MSPRSIYKSEAGRRALMALYDGVLARWPVPYEALDVQTRHGRTRVIASGPEGAPPVVLLHGSASNAAVWIAEAGALSADLRVLAVDIPGEAGRSEPVRAPLRGPAFAEWVGDLLDGLGLERAALVGLSLGGWVALRFATVSPERVSRVVLLAPGGIVGARPSFILRALPLLLAGRRGADAITRIVVGDEPLTEEAVTFTRAIMTHFRARPGGPRPLTDAELSRLDMPVLAFAGGRDALQSSRKLAERLSRTVAQSDVRVLPERGHVLTGLAPMFAPFLRSA